MADGGKSGSRDGRDHDRLKPVADKTRSDGPFPQRWPVLPVLAIGGLANVTRKASSDEDLAIPSCPVLYLPRRSRFVEERVLNANMDFHLIRFHRSDKIRCVLSRRLTVDTLGKVTLSD